MSVIKLINNRNFIFILALALGLLLGDKVSWLEYFTMPALAIVMTVSMTQLPLKDMKWRKGLLKPVAWTLFLNYAVFGTVILLLAWLLIEDKQLWYGFVVIAAAPPGVAIAPFVGVLSGNIRYSLIGVIGAYFASLVIIPLLGLIFIGGNFIQPVRLIIILTELIIGPFIISQILIKFKLDRFIKRWRGLFVNWGLFIIIFAVIALNREVLFKNPTVVGIVSAIAFITVFGLGFVIEALLKKSHTPAKERGHFILFATIKNGGFAAATALSLFGSKASLPGAVVSVFLILFLIILSFRARAISS